MTAEDLLTFSQFFATMLIEGSEDVFIEVIERDDVSTNEIKAKFELYT